MARYRYRRGHGIPAWRLFYLRHEGLMSTLKIFLLWWAMVTVVLALWWAVGAPVPVFRMLNG